MWKVVYFYQILVWESKVLLTIRSENADETTSAFRTNGNPVRYTGEAGKLLYIGDVVQILTFQFFTVSIKPMALRILV